MRWATQSYQHRLYCGSHMHASFISITRKSAGRDEGPPCCAAGAKDTSEAKECRRTATHGWAAEAVLLKVHVALPAGRLPRQSLLGHSGIVSLIHAFASTMHSCMHVIVAAAVTKIMKLQCSSCMTHFNFQAFRMPECQARTKAGRCFYGSYAALPLLHARTASVNCTAASAVRQHATIKAVNAEALCKFVIAGTKRSRLAHRRSGVYCEKHKESRQTRTGEARQAAPALHRRAFHTAPAPAARQARCMSTGTECPMCLAFSVGLFTAAQYAHILRCGHEAALGRSPAVPATCVLEG